MQYEEVDQEIKNRIAFIQQQGFPQIDYFIESQKISKLDIKSEREHFEKYLLWNMKDEATMKELENEEHEHVCIHEHHNQSFNKAGRISQNSIIDSHDDIENDYDHSNSLSKSRDELEVSRVSRLIKFKKDIVL